MKDSTNNNNNVPHLEPCGVAPRDDLLGRLVLVRALLLLVAGGLVDLLLLRRRRRRSALDPGGLLRTRVVLKT